MIRPFPFIQVVVHYLLVCSAVCEVILEGRPPSTLELVLERHDLNACRAVSFSRVQTHKLSLVPNAAQVVETAPSVRADRRLPGHWSDKAQEATSIVKIFGTDETYLWRAAKAECRDLEQSVHTTKDKTPSTQRVFSGVTLSPSLEVRELHISGPSENRVDFIFFSDGYTTEERDKFFSDASFLTEAISQNETFATVRPLINFHAAFTSSRESGVGSDGKPKKTVFGLYRPGTELRGVYVKNKDVARAACLSVGSRCNFPIILGNSPFYGGIGGEFTSITSSLLNGPLVLRHELGHSVLGVGEEYDGGVYNGSNADSSLTRPVKWDHWLTKPWPAGEPVRAERNALPLLVYPWTLLNISSPWTVSFATTGSFPHNILRFSISGVPRVADLIIRLDDESLPWLPKPDIGMDRWFYDIPQLGGPEGLSRGEHVLEFRLTEAGQEGLAQVCNVEVFEFGSEDEFVTEPGYIGAYPTYSDETFDEDVSLAPKKWNTTSYRPTNEDCLMRQVATTDFCPVCKEAMWLQLLKRMDLIDNVTVKCSEPDEGVQVRTITLSLVRLAQLRSPPREDESYEIEWRKDGEIVKDLSGLLEVSLADEDSVGQWNVQVAFKTPEVRKDEHGLLRAERNVSITTRCLA